MKSLDFQKVQYQQLIAHLMTSVRDTASFELQHKERQTQICLAEAHKALDELIFALVDEVELDSNETRL